MIGLIPKLQGLSHHGLLASQLRIDFANGWARFTEVLQLLCAIFGYLSVLALGLGQRFVGLGRRGAS